MQERTLCVVLCLVANACFEPGSAEQETDTETTGPDSTGSPPATTTGSPNPTTGSATTAPSSSASSTTSEGSETSSETTSPSPESSSSSSGGAPCDDACDPERASTCEANTAAACVRGASGCYEVQQTDCDEDTCLPGEGCVALARDCLEVLEDDPNADDGVYVLDVDGPGGIPPLDARCDMTTDGGGWTLIARNDQPDVFTKFNLDWQEYRDGFGPLAEGPFGWLGNEAIHALTVGGVDLEVRHSAAVHVYADFSVASEAALYELSVAATPLSMDGGHFVDGHDGRVFSTADADSDNSAENCAETRNAGWWYDACFSMSIASGTPGDPAYWRAGAPPLYFDWIEMWIR